MEWGYGVGSRAEKTGTFLHIWYVHIPLGMYWSIYGTCMCHGMFWYVHVPLEIYANLAILAVTCVYYWSPGVSLGP